MAPVAPLLLAALPWLAELPDPVARVGESSISKAELLARMAQSRAMDPERYDKMDDAARRCAAGRALDDMVRREVLAREAARLGVQLRSAPDDPEDVEDEATLRAAGITPEQWREELATNRLIEVLEERARGELPVADADVARWLEAHGAARTEKAAAIARRAIQVERWPDAREGWERALVEVAPMWRWEPSGCP